MKLSSTILIALLNTCLVSSQPVPEIETIYQTHYTTVMSTVIAGGNGGDATGAAGAAATNAATSAAATSAADAPATSTGATGATSTAESGADDGADAQAYGKAVSADTNSATQVATTAASSSATGTSTGSFPSESSGSGSEHSGKGTYYTPGLGSCGETNTDSDKIVAVSHELYDSMKTSGNSNDNPVCGKKIKASYKGKSVEVTVVDRCEGCSPDDLDFSPSAFSEIADQSLGRIDITWEWVN